MAESSFAGKVETVHGGLEGARAEQAVALLSEAGLAPDAAREALQGVICLARDDAGDLVGVSTVTTSRVPMLGGMRLWLHRSLVRNDAIEAEDEMVANAFGTLNAAYEPEGDDPIGLCLLVRDPEDMRRTPEAVSPRTGLIHAGFLDDGSQIRVRYFDQASIGPRDFPLPPLEERLKPPSLEDRYRIEPLSESDVTADDVLELWAREAAVSGEEAERRIHQVDLVAVDERDGLVGVCSSYLQRNRQLRMDLRHFRAFVAADHRRSSLAFLLALHGRDHLQRRSAEGAPDGGAGILYEVESDLLRRYRNEARWAATDFTYIGETPRGAHVRVHYFPGARIPLPA